MNAIVSALIGLDVHAANLRAHGDEKRSAIAPAFFIRRVADRVEAAKIIGEGVDMNACVGHRFAARYIGNRAFEQLRCAQGHGKCIWGRGRRRINVEVLRGEALAADLHAQHLPARQAAEGASTIGVRYCWLWPEW